MMAEAELEELAADIKANGQHVPIVVYDGMILDGRNRWTACETAGVEPRTSEWDGKGSPTEWVISMNLHRRHLTQSQKATVGNEALPLLEEEAKKRKLAALKKGDEPPVRALMHEREKVEQGRADEKAAKAAGTSPRYVAQAKKLQKEAPDLYAEVKAGKLTLTQAARQVKERNRELERQKNRALVDHTPPVTVTTNGHRYQTIVLDPPWDWGDEGDCDQYGRARPPYATMPIAEIAELPVNRLAADNAHIYLWITNRSLPKGFALLEAWGFRYITTLTWVKPSFGMGNYFRGSTEQVLFGVRGSLPLLRNDVGTHFFAPRPERHSEKPDVFYELVETCSPGPWLEMFSRKARNGWKVWGAEVAASAAL